MPFSFLQNLFIDAKGNSPVFPKQTKRELTFEKPGCSKLPQFLLVGSDHFKVLGLRVLGGLIL